MKALFKSAMLVAVAAMAFVSCSKDADVKNGEDRLVELTLTAGNPGAEANQLSGTRTEMEGVTPYWSVDDQIGVSTNGTSTNYKFNNTAKERALTTTFSGSTEISDVIYTYYPFSSLGVGPEGAKVEILVNQNPTATSFDGKADLLIGKPLTMSQSGTVVENLQFKRVGGIVKVVLKDMSKDGLLSEQHVKNLSITTDGENYLAGRVHLDLKAGTLTDMYSMQSNTVNALYTSATQYEVDGVNGSYLGVFPAVLPAGSKLTITANTEGFDIKKEITLPQDVDIMAGKVTTFTVSLLDQHITENESGLALPFVDDFTDLMKDASAVDLTTRKDKDNNLMYSASVNTYEGKGSGVRISSGSASGYFTTTDLNLSQPFSVLIKAKSWSSTETPGITVTAGESESLTTSNTTENTAYYLLSFDAKTDKTKLKFSTAGGKRAYIENIQVVEGHDIAVLNITSGLSMDIPGIGGASKVTYNIINPSDGATISADAGSNTWIHDFNYSTDKEVSFTVDANDTGETRIGEITFTYPNAVASQTVTITQTKIGGAVKFDTGIFTKTTPGLTGKWNAFDANRGAQLTSKNGDATYTKSDYTDPVTTVTIYASNNAASGSGTATVTVTDADGKATNLMYKSSTSATITGCGTASTAFEFTVPEGETLNGTIKVNVKATVNSVYFERVVINE